ncbi:hypothetical protein [Azohydromonas aeria]|uniref:hypothetical protein n=1 Tax=Azohydromonas aeria TaxID=2590212 RepID=UPI0018DF3C5E|nr:hypothetical protein [Azohydromonas aeria]
MFSGILNTVGVEVMPDMVAQLRRLRLHEKRLRRITVGECRRQDHANGFTCVRHVPVMGKRQVVVIVDIRGILNKAPVVAGAHQLPHCPLNIGKRENWQRGGVLAVVIDQPVDIVQIGGGCRAQGQPRQAQLLRSHLVRRVNRHRPVVAGRNAYCTIETPRIVVRSTSGQAERIIIRDQQIKITGIVAGRDSRKR